MDKSRLFKILIATVLISGTAAWAGVEHLNRRDLQKRYSLTLNLHQELQERFQRIQTLNQELTQGLKIERGRAEELETRLDEKTRSLSDLEAKLSSEQTVVRDLQARLMDMTDQVEQLQGELVVALEAQEDQVLTAREKEAIRLERVVVSNTSSPALSGRVVSVHEDWRFVIINLGWKAVRIGDTVSIFRNQDLLAKARIERVQEGMAAASILPAWDVADISINDLVRAM